MNIFSFNCLLCTLKYIRLLHEKQQNLLNKIGNITFNLKSESEFGWKLQKKSICELDGVSGFGQIKKS